MRTTLLAVLFIGLVASQETARADPNLVGDWTVVSAVKGGEKASAEKLKAMLVTFTDKTVTVKDGDRTEKAGYKADTKAKPKTIDVIPSQAPPGTVVPGIYELDGDDLKIVWNKEGGRPKDFKGEGESQAMLVLKRKK